MPTFKNVQNAIKINVKHVSQTKINALNAKIINMHK